MKAVQINEYGDPSVVTVAETDKPTIKEGQVLVEVHAASLNPFDTTIRAGYMKDAIPLELPVTLGGDFAGIVVETGDGVEHIVVGDKVYGQAHVVAGNSGAFAEYTVTSARQVAKLPQNLDFIQASSLPLVGASALQALTEHIRLSSEQKILINGAGGIGAIAIQVAKHLGAYVATTATGEGIGLAKQLGADEVIDYKAQDFSEVLSGYDAAFDTTPGKELDKVLSIVKPGGTVVSMLAQADESKAKVLQVTAITQSTKVTSEKLDALKKLVEDGVVQPNVGQVFPLDQARQAFEARESGNVQGKIVLKIR